MIAMFIETKSGGFIVLHDVPSRGVMGCVYGLPGRVMKNIDSQLLCPFSKYVVHREMLRSPVSVVALYLREVLFCHYAPVDPPLYP